MLVPNEAIVTLLDDEEFTHYTKARRLNIESCRWAADTFYGGHSSLLFHNLGPDRYPPVCPRIYFLTIVILGSKKVAINRASDFLIESLGHFVRHVGEVT
jgi:hypothetical protein